MVPWPQQPPGFGGEAADPPFDGPLGYIGSPCAQDDDCGPEGGVCLTDGFPNGMCSLPCEGMCPDSEGFATTFCIDTDELPVAGATLGSGACGSRCDYGLFPETGCRPNYGCAVTTRGSEPDKQAFSCLPNVVSAPTDCMLDLAERGVAFEPAVVRDDHPEGRPDLTCHIDEPVVILGEVHGVALLNYAGDPTPRVLAACNMAHSLTDTIDDVAAFGVSSVRHYGTYNCRVISGTDTLSRHGYGDAIDLFGFEFADGSLYSLEADWQHDTDVPDTAGAQFLYDAVHRWYASAYWNVLLTPNFNEAHDDHFHVDLTPGSDYLSFAEDGVRVNPNGD